MLHCELCGSCERCVIVDVVDAGTNDAYDGMMVGNDNFDSKTIETIMIMTVFIFDQWYANHISANSKARRGS